jgi:hypothetical protein
MSISVKTIFGTTTMIDILPKTEIGDIYNEANIDSRSEVLTFQGEDLKDFDLSLADAGIGTESVLYVRPKKVSFYLIESDDTSGNLIIMDFEEMKLYTIIYYSRGVNIQERPFRKIEDTLFEYDGNMEGQTLTCTLVDHEEHMIRNSNGVGLGFFGGDDDAVSERFVQKDEFTLPVDPKHFGTLKSVSLLYKMKGIFRGKFKLRQ